MARDFHLRCSLGHFEFFVCKNIIAVGLVPEFLIIFADNSAIGQLEDFARFVPNFLHAVGYIHIDHILVLYAGALVLMPRLKNLGKNILCGYFLGNDHNCEMTHWLISLKAASPPDDMFANISTPPAFNKQHKKPDNREHGYDNKRPE